MNRSEKAGKTASNAVISSDGALHLQGPWLYLARLGWISIIVPMYVLFLANIPAYFASLHLLHSPNGQMFTVQLTPADVHILQRLGLSLDFYATCMVMVSLLFQFSYATVGMLLFWRKADDRAALLTSFALMMLPFGFANITLPALLSGWSWLIPALDSLGNGSLMLCAFIFPNGQFVPRWTRWLALVLVGYCVVVAVFPSWQIDRSWLSLVLFFGLVVSTMLVQLYRYYYVSTPRERQQTKWAVFGVSIAVAGNIGPRLLYYFVLLPLLQGSSLAFALEVSLIMCLMLAIPLTLGIAILSSRLWDIDVLINRTLVYSTLTTTLILVYVGLVIGMQFLLHGIISLAFKSEIAIVCSTLVIAMLFQPLRRRLQWVIDRRFYRRKYDAVQTVVAFSATLHDEVDLKRLSEQLLAVVEETMQPKHVSLWLRSPEQPRDRKTQLLPRIDKEER